MNANIPTTENLAAFFVPGIRQRDEIVTATQDGKVPFVAVDDIVDAAFHFLTITKIESPQLFVHGPDLLSYDQVWSSPVFLCTF